MPQIESLLTPQPILDNVSLDFVVRDLVAEQVMPYADVRSYVATIPVYAEGDAVRLTNDLASPRSNIHETEFSLDMESIRLVDYGLQEPVAPDEVEQAGQVGYADLMARATEDVTRKLLYNHEKRVSDICEDAANFPTGNKLQLVGNAIWTNALSTPIADILNALDSTSVRPNRMLISGTYYRAIRQRTDILNAIAGRTGAPPVAGIASAQDIASLFEIEQIIIGRGKFNSAAPGQTPAMTSFWGNIALLYYVAPNVGQRTQTWAVTFTKDRRYVATYFDPSRGTKGCTVIKLSWNAALKILNPSNAYLFYE